MNAPGFCHFLMEKDRCNYRGFHRREVRGPQTGPDSGACWDPGFPLHEGWHGVCSSIRLLSCLWLQGSGELVRAALPLKTRFREVARCPCKAEISLSSLSLLLRNDARNTEIETGLLHEITFRELNRLREQS